MTTLAPDPGDPAADEFEIPDHATSVFICSCGGRGWLSDDATGEEREWFDNHVASHDTCDTDDTGWPTEHYDVARPEHGYVADHRDFFARASDARRLAELMRDHAARWLAGEVLDHDVDELDRSLYRRDVAALAYAEAVYEVEAAKVRAA